VTIVLATVVASAGAPSLSDVVLRASDGGAVALAPVIRRHRLTAIVFFSSTCPCFAAHRARLAALAQEMSARDVQFLVVDAEEHAAGEALPATLPESGLPILRDADARLAHALGARYATETFVFDGAGVLRYRGGIDDDRKYLHAAPRSYLRDALTALLRQNAPPFASSKALGCALRTK
jgi:hypothetical protein